jgi:hypothetical protein
MYDFKSGGFGVGIFPTSAGGLAERYRRPRMEGLAWEFRMLNDFELPANPLEGPAQHVPAVSTETVKVRASRAPIDLM